MFPLLNETARIEVVRCFADALQHSLAQQRDGEWCCMPSSTVLVQHCTSNVAGRVSGSVQIRGTLRGEVTMEVPEVEARSLFLIPENVVLDDVQRVWSALIQALVKYLPKRTADTGTFPFSVDACRTAEFPLQRVQIGSIEVRQGDQINATVMVFGDDELLESLQAAEWSIPKQMNSQAQPRRDLQLGRVLDVPLAVTLRFGQREMRLHEVLQLNTGMLVELDQQVDEPVNLMLGERVIARGEVVIVEGNYGLRVTEVVERNALRSV